MFIVRILVGMAVRYVEKQSWCLGLVRAGRLCPQTDYRSWSSIIFVKYMHMFDVQSTLRSRDYFTVL